jgi:transcriptional regulator with PAS, ATPase and Fis domain
MGETGTGKELVAKAMHHLSPHSAGQFVPVNCSSVVETLFESELFGHVKGAFTGATHDKIGLIEHANNGTLFLDEIGDMPLQLQSKLLRVLQDNEVQRLGSLVPRKINLRVLAATHCDLRTAIKERRFREDLFYRLSMIEIEVPRLVDREGDVMLLTRQLIAKFASRFGKQINGITRRAQILLNRHDWPGNVRELENAIGHACILVMTDTIDISDLPAYLHRNERMHSADEESSKVATVLKVGEMPSLEGQERKLVLEALTKAGGNQAKAARLLRISRDVLRYRMKKHSITV